MPDYHDEATLFPLFGFSVLILVLIPSTLAYAFGGKEAAGDAATNKALFATRGAKPKKGLLHNKALWLVLGWVTAGALLFYVSAITAPHELFEPYDILGLDSSATEREIKSKYRNLARIYHPDKNPDPAGQTFFVEKVQKAYKALTDETARANLKRYGHPDGPQGYSVGVALPKWLLNKNDGQAQVLILLGILLIGIMIPGAAVLYYLSRSEKFTTQGVKRDTLGRIAHMMSGKESLSATKVLPILVTCAEYTDMKYGGADKAEALQTLARDLKKVIEREEKIKDPKDMAKWLKRHPCVVKAHMLLLAYLDNSVAIPACLREDAEYIVKAAPLLLEEMVKFALMPHQKTGLGVLRPALSCLEVAQSVVRGVPLSTRKTLSGMAGKGADLSQLMQLPGIDEDACRALSKAGVKSLRELMALELGEARTMLQGNTKLGLIIAIFFYFRATTWNKKRASIAFTYAQRNGD
jgi:translocation protein SEC63